MDVFEALRDHYLAGIECDHDAKTDRALCSCSRVDLGKQPSVGAAVQTWIDHLRGVVEGAKETAEREERDKAAREYFESIE